MSDAAWAGVVAIFGGLIAMLSAVAQTWINGRNSVEIGLMKAEIEALKRENQELKTEIESLKDCPAEVIALKAEIRFLKEKIHDLEGRRAVPPG